MKGRLNHDEAWHLGRRLIQKLPILYMQAATACEDKYFHFSLSQKKKTKQKCLEKVADRAYAPLEIERIFTISARHNYWLTQCSPLGFDG